MSAVTRIMNQNLTKLRPAAQEDADRIEQLECELFPDNCWNSRTIVDQLDAGWVAERDGLIVGYALVAKSDALADLLRLGVTEPYRRQGLAGQLIELSLANHPAILTVQKGNPAIRLYCRHGFKVAGVIESAWLMRRA